MIFFNPPIKRQDATEELLRAAGTFPSCTLGPRTFESTSCLTCLKGTPLPHDCCFHQSKSTSVLRKCQQLTGNSGRMSQPGVSCLQQMCCCFPDMRKCHFKYWLFGGWGGLFYYVKEGFWLTKAHLQTLIRIYNCALDRRRYDCVSTNFLEEMLKLSLFVRCKC